jgi:hypothetical protein
MLSQVLQEQQGQSGGLWGTALQEYSITKCFYINSSVQIVKKLD